MGICLFSAFCSLMYKREKLKPLLVALQGFRIFFNSIQKVAKNETPKTRAHSSQLRLVIRRASWRNGRPVATANVTKTTRAQRTISLFDRIPCFSNGSFSERKLRAKKM